MGLSLDRGVGGCMQRSETGQRFFDSGRSEELHLKRILDFLPAFGNGIHRLTSSHLRTAISKKQDVSGPHLILATLNISITA